MRRRELSLLLDWTIFVTALVAFSTGPVLLFCFHVGDGPLAVSALGQGKLAWLNLHRFSAIVLVLGVVTHVALNWRALRGRLANIVRRRTRRPVDSELVMYAAFLVATVSGLVAWLVLGGSSPVFGPAVLGRASSVRHPWIDTHHLAALVALVLVTHHVGHRWRLMARPRPRAFG